MDSDDDVDGVSDAAVDGRVGSDNVAPLPPPHCRDQKKNSDGEEHYHTVGKDLDE